MTVFGYKLIKESDLAELIDRAKLEQWEEHSAAWEHRELRHENRINELISDGIALQKQRIELLEREAGHLSKIGQLKRAIERIEIKANNGHGYAPSFRSLAVLNDISEECAKTLNECRNIK